MQKVHFWLTCDVEKCLCLRRHQPWSQGVPPTISKGRALVTRLGRRVLGVHRKQCILPRNHTSARKDVWKRSREEKISASEGYCLANDWWFDKDKKTTYPPGRKLVTLKVSKTKHWVASNSRAVVVISSCTRDGKISFSMYAVLQS